MTGLGHNETICRGAAPIRRLAAPKLAVRGRYNQSLGLSVSCCSLQGIAERPLPWNYSVIRYDGALSRRQHGCKSRRGRQTFQNIDENRAGSVLRPALSGARVVQ